MNPSGCVRAPHFMTRRELLLLPGVCSLFGQELSSPEPPVLSTSEALNFTFPLEAIAGSVTPADRFFIRDHFREPELSLSSWRLKIEGRVEHPLELTLSDILESPTKVLEAVLECAGSPPDGSAASNAVWEGVPLARLLEKAGHVVTIAANGKEAVDQVATRPFDLVLMDVQMPEMDGLEATQVIRQQEKGKHMLFFAFGVEGAQQEVLAGLAPQSWRFLARTPFSEVLMMVSASIESASAANTNDLPAETVYEQVNDRLNKYQRMQSWMRDHG